MTREDITREEAIKTIEELIIPCGPNSKYRIVGRMAISALENKTPCSLCRFRDDDSYLCDICPAMPFYNTEMEENHA